MGNSKSLIPLRPENRLVMSHTKKLNELEASAICGNDISSSCLYVSALCISFAGQHAWVALLMVAAVLFLFRRIYGEVVGALPLNGGAYNVLLNTTSKSNASIAACLTILSYMATAVISASEAMHYLSHLVHELPVLAATVGVLGIFLLLTLLGMSESAIVAVVFFVLHLVSLTLLSGFAIWYLSTNSWETLWVNYQQPVAGGSMLTALFLGFSAAMLGISGFESSANFVEEQGHGIFPKTLRNMWIVVSIFNPLLAFLAIAILPITEIKANQEALLADLAEKSAGNWLATLVAVDAVLVLCGAVLTSFVGVSGLMKRMALDRVLPQVFLRENRSKANYTILLGFFLLCLSILLITGGQLGPLAGVYTISFLSVMAFFAVGNLLLKVKRARLPRPETAGIPTVFLAFISVIIAMYGNIKIHPDHLVVFLQYFIPALILIYAMLDRITILNMVLEALKGMAAQLRKFALLSQFKIRKIIDRLNNQEFVFFTKGDNISVLNRVMIYVEENEFTNRLKIVSVQKEGQAVSDEFLRDLEVLDRAYPNLHVEFLTVPGTFGPEIIEELSQKWGIAKNFMFIGSPSNRFPYRVSELGGVRVII